MSRTTAHILIGTSHPYRYCVLPSHVLTLHEGSQPLLVLRRYPIVLPEKLPAGLMPPGEVHWVPTAKHILEDALLMVAIHALEVPQVMKPAANFRKMPTATHMDLSNMDESRKLNLLRTRCRQHFPPRSKLAITLFHRSAFSDHVKVFRAYPMQVELCTAVYERFWNTSTEVVEEIGTLTIPTGTQRNPAADGEQPDAGFLAHLLRRREKRARTDLQQN